MIAALELRGWTVLDPVFLLGVPMFVLVAAWRLRRPGAALPSAQTELFAGLPRTLRARCRHLPLWASALAGCLLVVALARPVRRELLPQREQGVDIALVIDTSSSMSLTDMDEREPVRRVDAARIRALEFVAARTHDRVAFIAFARYAELRCPPTLDEQALRAFVGVTDAVAEGSDFDGTALGVALAKAVQVLERSTAKSKLCVLLSDGETTRNLPGTILPEDAAKLAADAGIRVHTVGIGQGMPTFGGFVPLEFRDLKLFAEKTGGRFFEARSDRDLQQVYAEIDRLEKTELEDPRYRMADGFALPLGAGLLLLLGSLLLEVFWIRRVP
jgi:Ca-activated chloride channel family protein